MITPSDQRGDGKAGQGAAPSSAPLSERRCIIRDCNNPVPMDRSNRAKDDGTPAWLCDAHYLPIARAMQAHVEAFEEAWQRERQQAYER